MIQDKDTKAEEEYFEAYIGEYKRQGYEYFLKSAIHHLIRSIELRKKKLLQDHCEVVA